ncbi:hypothetical protein BHE74_00039865 [Ensete ventricosum]|nr:hypothetical protein BHE74_00039865 [Ensete ventricosum]
MEEEQCAVRINKLEERVVKLIQEEKELEDQLQLIDHLQQLGVAYHFKYDIKDALGSIHGSLEDKSMLLKHNLHATALLFRLLRENGFDVSEGGSSFLHRFYGKGHLKACLQHQTKGMLSLYEASYLEKEGELVLSQAMDFTTKHLKKLMEQGSLEPPLREQVASALELPLHWRMHRLHASYRIMKEKNMKEEQNAARISNLEEEVVKLIQEEKELEDQLHQGPTFYQRCHPYSYLRTKGVEAGVVGLPPRMVASREEHLPRDCQVLSVLMTLGPHFNTKILLDDLPCPRSRHDVWILTPESPPGVAFILVRGRPVVPFPSIFVVSSAEVFNAAGTAGGRPCCGRAAIRSVHEAAAVSSPNHAIDIDHSFPGAPFIVHRTSYIVAPTERRSTGTGDDSSLLHVLNLLPLNIDEQSLDFYETSSAFIG